MKKIAALVTGATYLIIAVSIFAQGAPITSITVTKPPFGFGNISEFIKNSIILAFIVAIILVLVMLVIGAVQWIFSGGDKEALTSARGRIINSLIGLAILAVAFAIFVIAGQFLGFPVTDTGLTLPIPRPTI